MNTGTYTFDRNAGYRVVPMHSGVRSGAVILGRALAEGLAARPDPARKDFYWVEIDGVSYYFHVFARRRTAYLLSAEPVALESPPFREAAADCVTC